MKLEVTSSFTRSGDLHRHSSKKNALLFSSVLKDGVMLPAEGIPASGMAMEGSFTKNKPGVTDYMKGVPFGMHTKELARRHHLQGWFVVV
jgi:hypothetical protein